MKIKFVSEFNHNRKLVITMPEVPTLLRINKQVGCFASGLIRPGDNDSMQQFSRGRWLECAIASIDDDLEGIIGLGDSKRWAFVSAIIINAADTRIEKGDLIHFLSYGAERTTLTLLANKTKNSLPCIVRINFNLSISTQYKTVIRPPSISTRKHTNYELQYLEITKTLLSRYPDYFPAATSLYPAKYDCYTNKLVSGLVHLKAQVAPKAKGILESNSLKRISSLFWRND